MAETRPLPDASVAVNYEERLQTLMAQAGLSSYRALSAAAGVSRSALNPLRQGQSGKLQVSTLQRLSQALQVAPADLMAQFNDHPTLLDPPSISTSVSRDKDSTEISSALVSGRAGRESTTTAALHQECQRLQQQLTTQEQELRQQLQREALGVIESWLTQWPTALWAAQQNEAFLASKLIPLTRPLQELLKTWEVQPIGAVGEVTGYDPQIHQATEGFIEPGQPVQIRRVGYWHSDCLLYRAQVSLVG